MRSFHRFSVILTILVGFGHLNAEETPTTPPTPAGVITSHHRGLHGYIGYNASRPPSRSQYSMGMGFYAAVWPLIDKPLAHFQIGLPSAWITPNNSDNKDKPLAPVGTYARDNWPERGPTWGSVFQTVEGGLGYWARNHFRYGPPKFSMNATPQCYDYEVGSPGWSFFYDNEALPDNRLGIAQLSNRLLIPPDALPFEGNPNGKFLGYTYMALPFTKPTTGEPPTGDQAWTCFLSAANFKGPMAYYIPETWSKTGKLFDHPFIYGRGLDARPGNMGGGAMEINTVPRFDSTDAHGVVYSKLPVLQFPVDSQGRTLLVQDVTYYSKAALYNTFKAWRDGGPACSGRFEEKGAWKSTLTTSTPHYDQAGNSIDGVENVFDTEIFDNVWGLQWHDGTVNAFGRFPQYYKHVGETRVAVDAQDVPPETGLLTQEFKQAGLGVPYTSPYRGAWTNPGPRSQSYTVELVDGSVVTYAWYRFVDQPSFQQYAWSEAKKARLQAFVEKIHTHWTLDRDYMAPPSQGELAALDPALLVTPPAGLEVGYVPIVTHQRAAQSDSARPTRDRVNLIDFSSSRSIARRRPVLIAHRGGVITKAAPECSLAAIRLAQQQGYAMVELDVQKSRDGIPIIFHDRDLKTACGMDNRINNMDSKQIAEVRFSQTDQTIITLDRALDECLALSLGVMLDVKVRDDEPFFQTVAALIKKHQYETSTITISADPALRQCFKGVVMLTVTGNEFKRLQEGGAIDLRGKYWFGLPHRIPDDMIKRLHQNGAYVIPAINTFRYPPDNHYERARNDINRLMRAGVEGFQIDSVYKPLFDSD